MYATIQNVKSDNAGKHRYEVKVNGKRQGFIDGILNLDHEGNVKGIRYWEIQGDLDRKNKFEDEREAALACIRRNGRKIPEDIKVKKLASAVIADIDAEREDD